MTIDFKLEYNLREKRLRVIDGSFQGNWISCEKTDKFENPIFHLEKKEDWCLIRSSKNNDWLIMLVEYNNHFYNSFQRNDYDKNSFIFGKFEEVEKVNGRWEKINYQYN